MTAEQLTSRMDRRVALITGSGRGIGRATAVRLARQGFSVVVNDLREDDESGTTLAQVAEVGGQALFVAADVGRVGDVRRLVAEAVDWRGRLDVLVNNAGIEREAPFWQVTEDHYDRVMAINLKGAFFAAQAFVQHLLGAQRQGCIINISSVHEELPFPGFATYSLTKGGMQMLTRTLAVELGGHGIRINNVAPGAIRTPLNAPLFDQPAKVARLLENISLGTVGTPEDVAGVVAFLVSDDARYITGATYYVDGGLTWHYTER